jgi:hypothetical protein
VPLAIAAACGQDAGTTRRDLFAAGAAAAVLPAFLAQLPAKADEGEALTARGLQWLSGRRALRRRSAAIRLARAPRRPAAADPPGYSTFLGMASPPTSYGGYGGNANELPK